MAESPEVQAARHGERIAGITKTLEKIEENTARIPELLQQIKSLADAQERAFKAIDKQRVHVEEIEDRLDALEKRFDAVQNRAEGAKLVMRAVWTLLAALASGLITLAFKIFGNGG